MFWTRFHGTARSVGRQRDTGGLLRTPNSVNRSLFETPRMSQCFPRASPWSFTPNDRALAANGNSTDGLRPRSEEATKLGGRARPIRWHFLIQFRSYKYREDYT